jgi:hypothetical protein
MFMVMFVLDDPDRLDEVLYAWEALGVSGVTFIESTGVNRHRQAQQVGTIYMAGINRLIGGGDEGHITLFVIVPDKTMAEACLASVEQIVGDLDGPDNGVLAAWPLAIVEGVPNQPLPRQDPA